MPIGRVVYKMPDKTKRAIYIGSHNPITAHSQAISQACVEIACELLNRMSLAEIHAHIRERHPEHIAMLEYVEAGGKLPIEYRQSDWPVTPGAESQEIPIISELQKL